MNPIVKEKWLEALRSEQIQQTQKTLKDDNGFCCLGVLCELYVQDTESDILTEQVHFGKKVYNYDGESSVLPTSVRIWAGLNAENPRIPTPDKCKAELDHYRPDICLAKLNDNGYDFKAIADLIEEHL